MPMLIIIWLDMACRGPGDNLYTQKVNLAPTNDAQGWEGTGMNDIWKCANRSMQNPKVLKGRHLPVQHQANHAG